MGSLVIVILILLGCFIYIKKPKSFFFYWLGIQPYLLPVFFILLKPLFSPVEEKFLPLYFSYPIALSNLLFILGVIKVLQKRRSISLRVIGVPLFMLMFYMLVQNLYVGFNWGALYTNYRELLVILAPFLLLYCDERVRPNRTGFVKYICIFVGIQGIFCFFNVLGFRIYGEFSGIFDDSLICGTFARYNHMSNYLAAFFYVLSYEYHEYKGIRRSVYYFLALLIGIIVLMSGSRMTLILYSFTFLYFLCVYYGKKVFFLTSIVLVFIVGRYVMGNNRFYGQSSDEGTGFERNLIGIVNYANSDDLSEGSTLALSASLLINKFNSPLVGNGQSYRNSNFYGHNTDLINEFEYKTDARLAFMLVDYGIIGFFLFLFLYIGIYRGLSKYSSETNMYLYYGSFSFFLLFSLTDNGFWDYILFSVLLIYAFSFRPSIKLL